MSRDRASFPALVIVAMAAVSFVASLLGIALSQASGGIAVISFTNAIGVAVLLRALRTLWRTMMVAAATGILGAHLLAGDAPLVAVLLSLSTCLEIVICAVLFTRLVATTSLHHFREFMVFIGVAAGPAALTSSILSGVVATHSAHTESVAGLLQDIVQDALQGWVQWYAADALGLIVLTPFLLVLQRAELTEIFQPGQLPRLALTLAVTAGVLAATFLQSAMPLLFLAFPAVVISAFVLGYVGAAINIAMTIAVAIAATLAGVGPISLMQHDLQLDILVLQMFAGTVALTGLAVATLLMQLELIAAAFRQSADIKYIKTADGCYLAVNRNGLEKAGVMALQQLTPGAGLLRAAHPGDDPTTRDDREVLVEGLDLRNRPHSVIDRNGVPLWYESTKLPLRNRAGRIVGLSGLARDVTFQKELESSLRESHDRMALVMREMTNGIVLIDTDGLIVFCNERYQAFFPQTGHLRVPGARYRDLLAESVRLGEQLDIDPEERMRVVMRGGEQIIHMGDDSWLLLRAAPNPGGGTTIVVSDVTQLQRTSIQLRKTTEALKVLAVTDGLTGLLNRRSLDEALERETARAQRNRHPIAAIMIDVDRFKLFNDTKGHAAGDECLKKIADVLRLCARRPADLVARYGGEEMVAILPETDAAGAGKLAETMRLAVRKLGIAHEESEAGCVTISLGVGCLGGADPAWSGADLLGRADAALYAAKNSGRDRVYVFDTRRPEQPGALQQTG